jgi:DNA polymerase I-like protein with 3'-5' exonuclease and polymerase domains
VEEVLGPIFSASIFDIPDAEAVPYARRDATSTRGVLDILLSQIKSRHLEKLLDLDMSVVAYCAKCMESGMLIDKEHFRWFSGYLQDEMSGLEKRISNMVGQPLNPDSSDQLADVFFERLQIHKGGGIQLKRTPKIKRYQVDDAVLKAVSKRHPAVPLVIEFRELSKLKGTFSDPLPGMADEHGRIHTHLRLTRIPTGRLAAFSPNLMQIPTRTELGQLIRAGFIAPEGYSIVSHDLGAIEMRCAADLSGDELMIALLCDDSKDIHSETAARIWGKTLIDSPDPKVRYQNIDKLKERYPAKTCGFLLLYGGTAAGLSEQLTALGLQGWDEDACEKLIKEWYRVYKGVDAWVKEVHSHARLFGWVDAPLGRRLWLPQVWSTIPRIREEALRVAQNHPVQCLPGQTRVRTTKGFERIGDIAEARVWTGNEWANARRIDKGTGRIVEILFEDGAKFECDEAHYLLTSRGVWPEWVNVLDLKSGDRLPASIAGQLEDKGMDIESRDFWYCVGRYYGDGNLISKEYKCKGRRLPQKRLYSTWCFGGIKNLEVEEVRAAIRRAGYLSHKKKAEVVTKSGKHCVVWSVASYGMGRRMLELGIEPNQTAPTKRLADIIFKLKPEYRRAVIEGYYDADGTRLKREKRGGVSAKAITSVNIDLLRDFQLLNRSLGVGTWIFGPYGCSGQRDFYRLRLEKDTDRTVRGVCSQDAKTVRVIKSITPTVRIEQVFTMSVDHERHSFDTEGIVSKNSFAATILKMCIRNVWPILKNYWARGLDIKPLMPIHDELLHEVPNPLVEDFDKSMRPCFEGCMKMKVPIKVGFAAASSWGELEK